MSTESERIPRKGDGDYIKRPENAFILFRRKCCEDRAAAASNSSQASSSSSEAATADSAEANEGATDGEKKKQRQAELSKTISAQWKALSAPERAYWEELAKEKKRAHEAMYPHYTYRPQRRESKVRANMASGAGGRRRREETVDAPGQTIFVPCGPASPMAASEPSTVKGKKRRSLSAPGKAPVGFSQLVQVPSVLGPSPSCPPSPSLLPTISRRGSVQDGAASSSTSVSDFDFMGPGISGNGFDYVPPMESGHGQQAMPVDFSSEFIEVCCIPCSFRSLTNIIDV